MTFTQTDVNTIPASFVAGLTEVSAVGADHLLVYDATDNALKKALASDLIETVGATPTFTTANITNTTTGDSLLFTTTEDSSTAAPVITLKRNSSSPADADYLGQLKFKGENDADQEVVYAKITSKIQDASDGSEDGLLEFANIKAGSQTITARLKSDKLQLLNSTGLEVAGDLTVDTNTLYVDSTNNRVGIGTTSPTVLLDVYNSSGWGGIDVDGTLGGEIRFQKAGTNYGNIYANDSTGLIINAQNGLADIFLQSGGSTKMSILDSGRVGIGEVSPDTRLHIKNSGDADLKLENTSAGQTLRVDQNSIRTLTNSDIFIFCNDDSDNGVHLDASEQTFFIRAGTNLAARYGRVNSMVSIGSSYVNVYDFANLGNVNKARGMYMVTVCRETASVGTHAHFIVGVSTGSNAYLYKVLQNSGFVSPQISGSNLQLKISSGSVNCHVTVQPLGVHGAAS